MEFRMLFQGRGDGDRTGSCKVSPAPEQMTVMAAQSTAAQVNPGIRNVSILHLNVANMERALAWYQGVLGMKHVRDNGGPSADADRGRGPHARPRDPDPTYCRRA